MTKEQLIKNIVLACIDELMSEGLSDSEAVLVIGFVENLRQKVADEDQSDHFVSELQERLAQIENKTP